MEEEVRCVELKRSDSGGFGFSVFGGSGSGYPPVIYEIVADSPAALCGEVEAGDIIVEVNNKEVLTLTTKEVLRCLRLSNDLVTIKVKRDPCIRQKIRHHMASSRGALVPQQTKQQIRNNRDDRPITMGDRSLSSSNGKSKGNDENVPPVGPWPDPITNRETDSSSSDTDSSKSKLAATPKFEAFMMTGDLIINLNAKTTSNNASVLSKPFDSLSYGQCSTPASPEESDYRTRNKGTKREASAFHSPVAEKKGSFSYNSSFVRTSKSEDQIQKTSLSTVNIDIADDMASSLNTLLDTNSRPESSKSQSWDESADLKPSTTTQQPVVPVESPESAPDASTSTSTTASPTKYPSPTKKVDHFNGCSSHIPDSTWTPGDPKADHSENESSSELISALSSSEDADQPTATVSEVSSPSDNTSSGEGSLANVNWNLDLDSKSHHPLRGSFLDQIPPGLVSTENGVTKIVIDENKISVHVRPERWKPADAWALPTGNPMDRSPSRATETPPNSPLDMLVYGEDTVSALQETGREFHSASPPTDDESDLDSLHSFHYSPKAVDMPSASRLAKRLYNLEGFKKSDVSRHLCKNNDFSRVVAEEYLKYFDLMEDSLDGSLRKFLKQFCLIGETQERERVLAHFSKRYLDCNPGSFRSQDAVHTLTCALMLLNTDLHGENVGRKMTCGEFIENLADLNDGENFPRDVLKLLYHSIKTTPLEWAVDDDTDVAVAGEGTLGGTEGRIGFVGHNPFLEVPNPSCATEYKKGYVMRKCCLDSNGKRTPLGKRGWKMYYATLRDLVLYLHKDEHGFKKNQLYDSLHNSIRVHHALATKAVDYNKKQHVFRLQTADQSEFLFQTGDSKELQSWVDTINFVAASLSSPPLASAVGSQNKFQRPLMPVSHTKHNLREQLQDHENRILVLEKELEEHISHPPEKGAKSRLVHDYVEKENYLQFELKRFRSYTYLLRSRMAQYPELEPPLVETSIGEVDEPLPSLSDLQAVALLQQQQQLLPLVAPGSPNTAVWYTAPSSSTAGSPPLSANDVKRSLSDRYSYRAAIYKNNDEECG